MRRRLAVFFAVLAAMVFAAAPGFAAASGSPPDKDAGEESQEVADAANWFMSQRLAPNGAVDPNAYAAGAAQAAAMPTVAGTWTERTARSGTDGNDFSAAQVDKAAAHAPGRRCAGRRMPSLRSGLRA